MRRNLPIFLLLACFAFSALAYLEISTPPPFKEWWQSNSESTKVNIATFGEIPWGKNITGRLGLANPLNACSYLQTDSNSTHVQPILVAVRGDCQFALKTYYAQLAGAKLLVIVDNTYDDVSSKLLTASQGLAETLHIPTVLLTKRGGDKIIDSLQSSVEEINTILGTFHFDIQKADSVNYNLWLSSANPETFEFLKEWKQYYDILAPFSVMQPHFGNFQDEDPTYADINKENCLCGVSYCSIGLAEGSPYTGRDFLLEDLRQICLINQYGIESWWKYALEYAESCLSQDQDMEECSKFTLSKIEVDPDDIQYCVKKSFSSSDMTQCKRNRLLNAEREAAGMDRVFLFPSVVINTGQRFTYRGNLVPGKDLFETICNSFNSKPDVCNPSETALPNQASNQEASVNQDGSVDGTVTETPEPQKSDDSNTSLVVIGVVCSVVIGLGAFFLYRRKGASGHEGLLSEY